MNKNGRSAIIFSGLLHRSLQHTIESLRRHVISPLELLGGVDVFYHSWNTDKINNPRTGENGFEMDPESIGIYLPEARGFFESQDEFDLSLDLQALAEVNPMRRFTKTDEAAVSTLKNYLRAMESLERAWQFFDERKDVVYDRVVVTRSDLRFLNELSVPEFTQIRPPLADDVEATEGTSHMVSHPALWLPRFQCWGGVNDRFALGSETAVEIYCRRSKFAMGCILAGKMWNPESILKEWLRVNRVKLDFLDIVFQRVRTDGSSPAQDLGLFASSSLSTTVNSEAYSIKDSYNSEVTEHFLITAETASEKAENLIEVLNTLGTVEVIDCIHNENIENSGGVKEECALNAPETLDTNNCEDSDRNQAVANCFSGDDLPWMQGNFDPCRLTKALLHLSNRSDKGSAIWIVDEFVAGGVDGFSLLVKETAARNADFAVYDATSLEMGRGDRKSNTAEEFAMRKDVRFLPLLRISGRLMELILERIPNMEKGESLESTIHAIAVANGMSCISWLRIGETRGHFGVYQKESDVLKLSYGITYPVRDPGVHMAICRMPLIEFPRFSQVSREHSPISLEDYVFIKRYCDCQNIKRVVEFGPGNRTLALLDAGCAVISFEMDATRLADANDRFSGETKLQLSHFPTEYFDTIGDPDLWTDLVVIGIPFDGKEKMESYRHLCECALKLCGRVILSNARGYFQSEMAEVFEQLGMDVIRIPTKSGLAVITDKHTNYLSIVDITKGFEVFDKFKEIWGIDSIYALIHLFQVKEGACKILHTGASDGMTAIFLLNFIFTGEKSEVHCIDMYDGEEGEARRVSFSENVVNAGHFQQIHLYEGQSGEILAWMTASEGYWQSFNFAVLNSRKGLPGDQLADACQTWMLLKPGGIMVLAADGKSNEIDAFIEAFGRRAELMLAGRQVFVRKVC